jgi:ParB family transcriptional regulator, chromosome partitioning protein
MAGKEKKAAKGKANEWQVEWLEINSINPYENNARKNDATIPYLKNSIQRFGFRVPLVIGKGNVVVCGHTRLKAALELGMEKLPCVRADDLTDAELKAFRLADNKVQELSGWDFEKLDVEMEQLKIDFDGDMVDFGFGDTDNLDPDDFFDDAGDKEKKKKTISVTCPDCGKTFEVEV